MRTLVVSDLHLGHRRRSDVLAHPEPLEHLLAALDAVERLVLLGDTVELMDGRARAMEIAEPVLRAVGERLGREREVILVPGNHDAPLVWPWVREHGKELGIDTAIGLGTTPTLKRVASWLAPARVRVNYPGVWLSDRIWATHGHYLDRHLLPESAVGIARGLLGRLPRDGAVPADYELAGGPSFAQVESLLTRWLPEPLAAPLGTLVELSRAATMPRMPTQHIPAGVAPLTARLLSVQMRRASIPALARVVHRLGVPAEWVLFGHVHRLGPLPGDDPLRWVGPGGGPRIANTGSWLYEPRLVHRASPPHPYWPGGAILIEGDADPRPIGLLNDLDVRAMR